MEIKKSHIITFVIAIILCIASFCTGRFVRFKRISGASEQLESGIILTGDQLNQIADDLNIQRGSIKSAAELGRAINQGIETAGRGSELGQICIDAIKRSIDADRKFAEDISTIEEGYLSTVQRSIELAAERAKLYERIISSYNEAIGDIGENSK